ncbi:diphthine--ammonia ligase-like [Diaphorina citri]|uniref:Diphthine--ammonia ligase-like n=1 Tax=Diaphorina citri TaxID=121845 RepID=A0A3Q0ISG9_DIACI|nr:diphthine--ammonia ligase-like [Diaphorina citri]
MAEYPLVNEVYHKYFNHTNPPIRACVQTILPDNVPVILDAVCKNQTEHNPNFLHVQSISHWAPANIGPYSQAARVNDIIYIAGMIPLVPGSMKLLEAGILQQCKLALRHVHRVIKAMDQNTHIRDVVMGFCFVTNKLHIDIARREWEKRTNNGIVDYIVVTGLPRNALVEWYVWAHRANNTFQYEETGYCLNDHHHVSLRRRWNYDNSVSAIVCYVSNGLSLSIGNVAQVTANQEEDLNIKTLPEATLLEIVQYVMSRLLNENKQLTYVANFKIFYKASAMNSSVIENVFHQLIQQYTIVPTIIPVKHLQNPNTIVSICALRHY